MRSVKNKLSIQEKVQYLNKLQTFIYLNKKSAKGSSQGIKETLLCKTFGQKSIVFKPFAVNNYSDLIFPIKDEMIYEVCASHIMKEFGIPTITYKIASGEISGERKMGVVSEYINCKNLEQDPSLIQNIKNPDEGIKGMMYDAWLGNFDRIITNSNLWVQNDGIIIFGDYECSFRKGITVYGLPKANLAFMYLYAKKNIVEDTIENIISLSDENIKNLIEDVFNFNQLKKETLQKHMINVLISNRNELKKCNPFQPFYQKKPVTIKLSREETSYIAASLLSKYEYKRYSLSFTINKILEDSPFYLKEISNNSIMKLICNSLVSIIENYIKGKARGLTISLKETEIIYGLNNPSLMKSIKKWVYNKLTEIIFNLF